MTKYDGLSVDELLQARSDIEIELARRVSELERQLSAIKSGAATKAVTSFAKPKTPKEPAQKKKEPTQKKSGTKVVAMYRNPKTGEEWSGRGRPARWLAAEVAYGKSKDDFLVQHS